MPLRWKIFRAANLGQLTLAIACLLFITVNVFRRGLPETYLFILFSLGLLSMLCNSYINLHVLRTCFPDRSIGPELRKVRTALLIVSILFCTLLSVVIIAGSLDEFRNENTHDYTGKLLLGGFFVVLANWVYIVVMQIKLGRVISREHHRTMNAIINSIGQG